MRIGKGGARCGERFHMRRGHLRMIAQRGDPIIEIIDDDQQQILRAPTSACIGSNKACLRATCYCGCARQSTHGKTPACEMNYAASPDFPQTLLAFAHF